MIRLVAFSLFMLTLVLGASLSASATTIVLSTTIDGAQEVPASGSAGTATALIHFGSNAGVIEWSIDFSGLSSSLTAAHFHNGAPGVNAPPVIDLFTNGTVTMSGDGTSGQLTGRAVVPDDQIQNLLNGGWYVNLHTSELPAGEIRGQVAGEIPVPEPTTALLIGAGALILAARQGRSLH